MAIQDLTRAPFVHQDDPSRVQLLPESWRNVSGLNLMSMGDLNALGWFPFEDTPRPSHNSIHNFLLGSISFEDQVAKRVWTVTRKSSIPSVEDFAAERLEKINSDCSEVILKRLPIYKQLNYQGRALELTEKYAVEGTNLAPEELMQVAYIRGEWIWLNAQRAESNRLEGVIIGIVEDGVLSDDDKRNAISLLEFEEVET